MPSNSPKDDYRQSDKSSNEITKKESPRGENKFSIIQSMLNQIRNGTPIYRVQLPIFLQEPRSLLERYSDFCSHMDTFTSVADIDDPEPRFLAVVKYYLSGWHARPKELKNPFNPTLGETFRCSYKHTDSTTKFIAEQISHHPPSSAFCVINEEKGMYLSAYARPSFRFKGNSLESKLQGKIAGHSKTHNEDYEITFPQFVVGGLLIGTLNLTLNGKAKVSCPQSGYTAEMEFSSEGIFSGTPNFVNAVIKHCDRNTALYKIEGRWDDVVTIKDQDGETNVFFDCDTLPITEAVIPPLEEQAENESRRVWQKVIENVLNNNEKEALEEKTIVEERQRALARVSKEEDWSPKLFTKINDDFYVHNSLIELSPIFSS